MQLSKYMALVSRYKLPLMGVCIFTVVFAHSGILIFGPASYVKLGVWCMDVFFFLSGMGAHFSLSKNNDTAQFLKRRFNRIYIPYFPIIILYFIIIGADTVLRCGAPETLRMLFGNLTMLGWICGMDCQYNWYPQAVALVYLITPVVFALVKKAGDEPKKLIYLLLFVCLVQPCFFGTCCLIVSSRFISFMLGMTACELVKRGIDLKLNVPFILILWVAGHFLSYLGMGASQDTVWRYGVQWLPGSLSVLGNMLIFCMFFELIEKLRSLRFIMALNNAAGRYSYEILLVQLLLYMLVPKLNIKAMKTPGALNVLLWIPVMAITVFIGVIYGKLIEKLRKKNK